MTEHNYSIYTGVSISTLWPATVIKSHVTDKGNVPDKFMRTPEIFADAILGIVNEPTQKYAYYFYKQGMVISCK